MRIHKAFEIEKMCDDVRPALTTVRFGPAGDGTGNWLAAASNGFGLAVVPVMHEDDDPSEPFVVSGDVLRAARMMIGRTQELRFWYEPEYVRLVTGARYPHPKTDNGLPILPDYDGTRPNCSSFPDYSRIVSDLDNRESRPEHTDIGFSLGLLTTLSRAIGGGGKMPMRIRPTTDTGPMVVIIVTPDKHVRWLEPPFGLLMPHYSPATLNRQTIRWRE